MLFVAAFAQPATGFEYLQDSLHSKATCDTACHLPENIKRARAEKNQKAECTSCHQGTLPQKALTPFQPPDRYLFTESQKPNRRILSPRPAVRAGQSVPSAPTRKSKKNAKFPGMVFIEAGEFIMGSNERWDDESPEHINQTDAFYIDLYEVTNRDYKKFVDATKRPPPHHWTQGNIPKGKEDHPVTYVSWFDANDYCQWTGKRLPNEEEWEKAARGQDGNIYPWGNLWSLDKSNNPYKQSTGTQPVGSYPEGRSVYGLYDMSGNVWEWVDAYYLPHPGNTIPKAEYGKDKRVLKGGSWFDCLSYGCGLSAPTFNRSFFNPEVKNNSFGFRCAKNP
ncbi:MAG: formylglycine-generating enzyme family protein [Nitrospinota bacterium]|nr:formylglycine-generating enzyme family protein [Nitrospinota bacterium]